MLCLRLIKALEPHTEIAKAHVAMMKEAAYTWQQRTIKLIEDATSGVQIDNKKIVKDIQKEAQRSVNETKKQLEDNIILTVTGIWYRKSFTGLTNNILDIRGKP
jgi:hypothetical protein